MSNLLKFMDFSGHQSLSVKLSNIVGQKNTRKHRKFWKYAKWQLTLRSWKPKKGHGKSHGIWRAPKSANPIQVILEISITYISVGCEQSVHVWFPKAMLSSVLCNGVVAVIVM